VIWDWIHGYNLNIHWSRRRSDPDLGIARRPFIGFVRDEGSRNNCWMAFIGKLVVTWDYIL
jgi:hypothetical protein